MPKLGHIRAGSYEQYVIALANRDPRAFASPDHFQPARADVDKALTWNGRAFGTEEDSYPRICPGRHLSMAIIKVLVAVAMGDEVQPNA